MFTENQVWLEDGLRGVLTRPVKTVRAILLVCLPLFEERKGVYRPVVDLARALALHGWATLRFDYRGTGESDGACHEVQLEQCVRDGLAAVNWVREKTSPPVPLYLLGIRSGAPVAIELSATQASRRLVLWEPLVDGAAFLRAKLREQLMKDALTPGTRRVTVNDRLTQLNKGETVDLGGYPLTPRLASQLGAITPESIVPRGPTLPDTLCISISASPRGTPAVQRFAESWQRHNGSATFKTLHAPPVWNQVGIVRCGELIRETVAGLLETGPEEPASSLCISEAVPHGLAAGEHPVVIGSADHALQAVLHVPASKTPKAVVVFCHGWSGNRQGPHRMFVHAARQLALSGVTALRFDYRGRGDSSGTVDEASIQSMTEDARKAVNWVQRNLDAERVFLLGICSGCKVALSAATVGNAIKGLVLWSPEPMGRLKTRRAQDAKSRAVLATYIRKLFRRQTWRKLIRGEVNTSMVQRALRQDEVASRDEIADEDRTLSAFSSFPGEVLCVHGSSDPETVVSHPNYSRFFQQSRIPHESVLIEGANHSYYGMEWEEQVLTVTQKWIDLRTRQL